MGRFEGHYYWHNNIFNYIGNNKQKNEEAHIKKACEGGHYLKTAEMRCTKEMYESAIASTNLAVLAAIGEDFAVTRPPGHHSGPNYAKWFCLFNNVAIATSVLLESGKRVAIIDIDGHYGNGTEAIFSTNDNVFYGSLHQKDSFLSNRRIRWNILEKREKKLSVMVELTPWTDDEKYIEKFQHLVDAVKAFDPDCIGVSAGFDSFSDDSLLSLGCSVKVYHEIGRMISGIGKKVFAVLEGGYHHSVAECIESFVAGVNAGAATPKERRG